MCPDEQKCPQLKATEAEESPKRKWSEGQGTDEPALLTWRGLGGHKSASQPTHCSKFVPPALYPAAVYTHFPKSTTVSGREELGSYGNYGEMAHQLSGCGVTKKG